MSAPTLTLPGSLLLAHETSLSKLHDAEWFFLWRSWAIDKEAGCLEKIGGRWSIRDLFGKGWPLFPSRGEAFARVSMLITSEARHRARRGFEAAAATCTDPHTCDQCGDAWPFDPARLVLCPDCGALIGHPCKRPSGHPLYANSFHASREPAAMAAGILQRCKAAPMPEITRQPALF